MQTDLYMICVKRYRSFFSNSTAWRNAPSVAVPPPECGIPLLIIDKALVLFINSPDAGYEKTLCENVRIANSLTGNKLIKSLARSICRLWVDVQIGVSQRATACVLHIIHWSIIHISSLSSWFTQSLQAQATRSSQGLAPSVLDTQIRMPPRMAHLRSRQHHITNTPWTGSYWIGILNHLHGAPVRKMYDAIQCVVKGMLYWQQLNSYSYDH